MSQIGNKARLDKAFREKIKIITLRPDQLRRTMVNSRMNSKSPSISSYKNEKRRRGKESREIRGKKTSAL